MFMLLWLLVLILFAGWILGFALHVAGSLIHILLVLAIVLAIGNLLRGGGRGWGRRSTP
jgi:hypothetical protein